MDRLFRDRVRSLLPRLLPRSPLPVCAGAPTKPHRLPVRARVHRLLRFTALSLAFIVCGTVTTAFASAPRNLFTELLGKSDAEVTAKIETAWRQLFHGDDATQRVYYPVGDDMAYIADLGAQDVRSEGMSYGMMIAVQLDRRAEFDRIWKWAHTHMRHASGPRAGYFAWQCRFDGTPIDPGSASDGEVWLATALLFASHRWGDAPGDSIFNYQREAQALLRLMLHKPATDVITPIFDRAQRQVVFAPTPEAATLTDPSYHVPHFYTLWARWADDPADRAFWADAATESRAFFKRAAHPATGLMPEYAHFDGRPFTNEKFGKGKGDFRYDAWRTLAHVALDHAWGSGDAWQREQSNRVLRFLAAQGPRYANQFTLAGEPLSKNHSTGLVATAAVAGLAADPAIARPFVQALWDAPIPSGKWRYYDGLLYLLGLLQTSGRFHVIAPPAPAST